MAEDKPENKSGKFSRRDILAGLAALPIAGIVGYGLFRNKADAENRNSSLLDEIKPEIMSGIPPLIEGKIIRIGIIGCGGRHGIWQHCLRQYIPANLCML